MGDKTQGTGLQNQNKVQHKTGVLKIMALEFPHYIVAHGENWIEVKAEFETESISYN